MVALCGGCSHTRGVVALSCAVSVEMMEHCKNLETLFARVSRWLRPDGKMFVHIFTHRSQPYHFDKYVNTWAAIGWCTTCVVYDVPL